MDARRRLVINLVFGLAVFALVFGGSLALRFVQGEASPVATPTLAFIGYLLYRRAWGRVGRAI
jgi:hypothetical protein